MPRRTSIPLALVGALAALAIPSQAFGAAATQGAAIFVSGDITGVVDVFNQSGVEVDDWNGGMTVGDRMTVGDVNGDGIDEVLIAGDVTGRVDIFDQAGLPMGSFGGGYTFGDGFATGDLDGNGTDEILIAGDVTGVLDIFNATGGRPFPAFGSGFTPFDALATGDLDGNGTDEILIAGDVTGTLDIFNATGGRPFPAFGSGFTLADGLAAGDVDGNGTDEILIAGDVTGVIDIFNSAGGRPFPAFGGGFTLADGFASGDVNADGTDEILVAGDVTGVIDIFNATGGRPFPAFGGGFTLGDGFAVATSRYPDVDGDGLLDNWETAGMDVDGDGTIDVNLPAFGATPMHKDLFLELDVMAGNAPLRLDIQRMKAAFAAAPVNAGGTSNPDGLPGINLWVDTGSLTDSNASEDGVAGPSCGDGIDNGGGDGSDAADADCLVGDNLGGGSMLPATAVPDLDGSFYAIKGASFNANRAFAFRYAISAAPGFEDGSTAGNSCFDGADNGGGDETGDGVAEVDGNDSDCWPWGGGWGEVGGNDFVEYNHDGGTIMHELGHNLGFRHGGNEDANCKPNYVSVMNYDNQFGINRTGGGIILDYSPPRTTAGNRGTVPSVVLVENNLNEGTILDATDGSNLFVFKNGNGLAVQSPLNAAVDWNGDGDTGDNPVTANIDTAGSNGTATTADDSPPACANGSTSSSLASFDDWTNISVPFRQFGDSNSGAINKWPEPEMTLPELERLQEALHTTDVSVTLADAPDPVAAGTSLVYTATVRNNGPNPADAVRLVVGLPADVSVASVPPGCSAAGVLVTCQLGLLPSFAVRTVAITTSVPADLVFLNGGPKTISANASVDNVGWPDSVPANDGDGESTQVIAVADLEVVSTAAVTPPVELVVGDTGSVTIRDVVSNRGPSAPMDVRLQRTASADAGATVTPAFSSATSAALARDELRPLQRSYTIACSSPGPHTFSFTTAISPQHAADTDPNAANNAKSTSIVVDCLIPVKIDVKPGSTRNPINLNERSVPVAVLTTRPGEYGLPLAVDATSIDVATVRFGPRAIVDAHGGASEIHARGHVEDVRENGARDGDTDLVLHFEARASGLAVGDTEACVRGELLDGGVRYRFVGCDAVDVIR